MAANRVIPEVPRIAEQEENQPRTVVSAKVVEVALIKYRDEDGREVTTLGVVGDSNIHLFDAQTMGISRAPTPTGPANSWLRDGVFAKLGRKPK